MDEHTERQNIDRFIERQNIVHYIDQLKTEADLATRKMLQTLLAEEITKRACHNKKLKKVDRKVAVNETFITVTIRPADRPTSSIQEWAKHCLPCTNSA